MMNKLEILKKRLIYRASYRGTKEMDILLSTFVNKFIDTFNHEYLNELDKFLNFDDEIILNYYQHGIIKNSIDQNKISKTFKDYKI
jgi:antitoxin CptB